MLRTITDAVISFELTPPDAQDMLLRYCRH